VNTGIFTIEKPYDNKIITSPADCTFNQNFEIKKDLSINEIKLKKFHKAANISELIINSEYKEHFSDGLFVHYYLAPHSYHRFHSPVSGVIKECHPVKGLSFLEVTINEDGQFHMPDDALNGYQFTQARGVFTVDTSKSEYGDLGIVTVIPIGMCQVSSVNMSAQVGKNVLKGDEFGYFTFGGSDIILLFEKKAKIILSKNKNSVLPGEQIAISN
jgi:phosphatidylserine decarboxylase